MPAVMPAAPSPAEKVRRLTPAIVDVDPDFDFIFI
jgi:hypothetical protein